MNGKGEFIYPDGRVYTGSFLKDKKHGSGELKLPSGAVIQGNWYDISMIILLFEKELWEIGRTGYNDK